VEIELGKKFKPIHWTMLQLYPAAILGKDVFDSLCDAVSHISKERV